MIPTRINLQLQVEIWMFDGLFSYVPNFGGLWFRKSFVFRVIFHLFFGIPLYYTLRFKWFLSGRSNHSLLGNRRGHFPRRCYTILAFFVQIFYFLLSPTNTSVYTPLGYSTDFILYFLSIIQKRKLNWRIHKQNHT